MKKVFLWAAVAFLLGASTFAFGCKNDPVAGDITVYMPDGAPAIALSGLMHADTDEDGVSYRVVDPKWIGGKVTYKDMAENADICVLPITTATQNVGGGDKYQMLGAVTHGNLYMISKNTQVQYAAENVSALIGKTVGVLQLASTPGLIFKTVLSKNGVPFQELSGGNQVAADKVNLRSLSSAADMPTLMEEGVDVFVLAEPAVTAQSGKGFSCVGDLQAMYGEGGYPQAVLVAKKSLIEEKRDWLDEFLLSVAESARWATTASGESIVAAVGAHLEDPDYAMTLKAPLLSSGVVLRCGVRFESMGVCKGKTQAFLQSAYEVDARTVLPAEAFYCI